MIRRLVFYIRAIHFFVRNKYRYRKLCLSAFIQKPLRIDGRKYISIYKNVIIQQYSWLFALAIDEHEPELIIHEGCQLGNYNHIAAVRRVIIGKNVLTADNVYISDNLHSYEDIDIPIMHQPVKFKSEVYIGDGSWLGVNVCVIGARIGKNCVIGANAVVTTDIPDYCVAVGAPAKVLKRFNQQTKTWELVDHG
jgi:acetyltransferase-like isoleucine patch superfamily enzyme